MPIELTIHKVVLLGDIWCSKEAWDDVLHDREALIELLNEDTPEVVEECGGLDGLIQSARWVD